MVLRVLTERAALTLLTVCCAATVVSCASKPSEFYLLRSAPDVGIEQAAMKGDTPPSLLVGPISLPAYLDRSQVVTIKGANEVVVDEFNRWGEPLEDSFYRVLTEDLSRLTGSSQIYAFNQQGSPPVDFQVRIDVTRFDSSIGGRSHLTAFWEVVDRTTGKTALRRKSHLVSAGSAEDTGGRIQEQNGLLNQLSVEISEAVLSQQDEVR